MPCWYYDKKELRNTPSFLDGIDPATESRYRREGAKFIIDAGTKMGLRYETYATGVIYFHRFYMFHSFREFHRHVTAACCIFLAGKVEETPKKCKDLVKVARSQLTDAQMQVFGEDPKEEIMTMERILLQTIKFDLMVEHPYSYILKYAKCIKGDKAKTEKMIQMAWTFVNDSFCTTLGLQWEPEIVAVALVYLASRLSKVDITDWVGKVPGVKMKWWDSFVDDVSLELLEDVCHQMLDLYSSSSNNQSQSQKGESPPPPPPPKPAPSHAHVQAQHGSKRKSMTPKEAIGGPAAKIEKQHHQKPLVKSPTGSSEKRKSKIPITHAPKIANPGGLPQVIPKAQPIPVASASAGSLAGAVNPRPGYPADEDNITAYNPYMSSDMYSSSFMSQEGSQNIKSLLGGGGQQGQQPVPQAASGYTDYRGQQPRAPQYSQAPPTATSHQSPYQAGGGYQQTNYQQPPPQQPMCTDYHHGQYPQQYSSSQTTQQYPAATGDASRQYNQPYTSQPYSSYTDGAGQTSQGYGGHVQNNYGTSVQNQWSGSQGSSGGSQYGSSYQAPKTNNYPMNTGYSMPNTPSGSRPQQRQQPHNPGGVASIRITNSRR